MSSRFCLISRISLLITQKPARYLQLFSTEVVINQTPKIPISIYFLNITLQSISVRMRRKYEKMSLRKIDDWMRLIRYVSITRLLKLMIIYRNCMLYFGTHKSCLFSVIACTSEMGFHTYSQYKLHSAHRHI